MANFLHLSLQINTKSVLQRAGWTLHASRCLLNMWHHVILSAKTTVDKKMMMNAGMYFSSVRLWNILQANVTCFVFYKDT